MVDILNIGQTGLSAAKKSLETTGHNISNVNTKGYSRQRVEQSTSMPVTKNGLIQGTGVRVTGVNRIHDTHIQKRLQNAHSSESFSEKRYNELTQVENIFNELDREGLNNILNKFYISSLTVVVLFIYGKYVKTLSWSTAVAISKCDIKHVKNMK